MCARFGLGRSIEGRYIIGFYGFKSNQETAQGLTSSYLFSVWAPTHLLYLDTHSALADNSHVVSCEELEIFAFYKIYVLL